MALRWAAWWPGGALPWWWGDSRLDNTGDLEVVLMGTFCHTHTHREPLYTHTHYTTTHAHYAHKRTHRHHVHKHTHTHTLFERGVIPRLAWLNQRGKMYASLRVASYCDHATPSYITATQLQTHSYSATTLLDGCGQQISYIPATRLQLYDHTTAIR